MATSDYRAAAAHPKAGRTVIATVKTPENVKFKKSSSPKLGVSTPLPYNR